MSRSERSVQHHKRQTDLAMHRAYVYLANYPAVLNKFNELLSFARKRAPRLLATPIVDGDHLGISALVNLARFRDWHIRPLITWAGTPSSWRPAVASLAQHLVCPYKVPAFLASSWYTDLADDQKRIWMMKHARGASFRSLDLPVAMTRRMETLFLASPDHLSIEHAIRKAELVALGASRELIRAILSTPLGTDLRHGEFWRTVWLFMIANASDLDISQVGPMIDYIHTVRHHRITEETVDGNMELDPVSPDFSMKGRTVQSMMRLMRSWHGSLASSHAGFSWTRSTFQPLLLEEPAHNTAEKPVHWQITELTNSTQLRNEGATLHHCVASYSGRCYSGLSRIWSLRLWRGENVRSLLTIEIDPKTRTIVQARGRANRMPSGKPLQLMQDWATREKLRIAI